MGSQPSIRMPDMENQPSIRMPDMKYIDVFTSKNVLRCLGFVREELDGPYRPLVDALEKGGVMRKNLGVLSTLVRGGLQASYVRSEIDGNYTPDTFKVDLSPSNLILAQYDLRKGKKTSLRGIALCQVKYDRKMVTTDLHLDEIDLNKVSMELLVLGNATTSGAILRTSVDSQGGGNMIRLVQYIGSKLPNGVFLNGLETVLPLYHHFGWRISSARNAENNSCPISESRASTRQGEVSTRVGRFMETHGPRPYTDRLSKELTKILSYAHGKHEYEELAKGESVDARETARDSGYPMILCPENNPYHILTRQAGGRRKIKKRTKKRAPRKKHHVKKSKHKITPHTRKYKRRTHRNRRH